MVLSPLARRPSSTFHISLTLSLYLFPRGFLRCSLIYSLVIMPEKTLFKVRALRLTNDGMNGTYLVSLAFAMVSYSNAPFARNFHRMPSLRISREG